jgi:hypothetical protein
MKVKINEKWFEGRFALMSFLIPLTDEEDVKFFYKWQKKANRGLPKSDYVEDIECKGICELGLLKSCRPYLDVNEKFVILNYDAYKTIEVYE